MESSRAASDNKTLAALKAALQVAERDLSAAKAALQHADGQGGDGVAEQSDVSAYEEALSATTTFRAQLARNALNISRVDDLTKRSAEKSAEATRLFERERQRMTDEWGGEAALGAADVR